MRGKLYLFGGSSCPDATECLPGVHSFDIGEDVEEAGWRGIRAPSTSFIPFFLSFGYSSLALSPDLHWSTLCFVNSVSDLGLLCSQWRGPQNTQTQLCGCGRQHLRVRRPAGGKTHQWSHGLQHRSRLMLETQRALTVDVPTLDSLDELLDCFNLSHQQNKRKMSVWHYSVRQISPWDEIYCSKINWMTLGCETFSRSSV